MGQNAPKAAGHSPALARRGLRAGASAPSARGAAPRAAGRVAKPHSGAVPSRAGAGGRPRDRPCAGADPRARAPGARGGRRPLADQRLLRRASRWGTASRRPGHLRAEGNAGARGGRRRDPSRRHERAGRQCHLGGGRRAAARVLLRAPRALREGAARGSGGEARRRHRLRGHDGKRAPRRTAPALPAAAGRERAALLERRAHQPASVLRHSGHVGEPLAARWRRDARHRARGAGTRYATCRFARRACPSVATCRSAWRSRGHPCRA